MSAISSAGLVPYRTRATPLLSALFLAFAALVLARVVLNPLLLDLVMNYTEEGGSIVEKIHPTFWGFLAVGAIVLVTQRIYLTAWEVRVVRALLAFCAACIGLLVFAAATGRSASVGYVLDTYVTLATLALMFAFPAPWRRALGQALVSYLLASAALGIVEFLLRFRTMPFVESEAVFRPTGLSAHPLELGMWCAAGIGFAAAAPWPGRRRVAACALLLVGCVASGARTATLLASVSAVILLVAGVGAGTPAQRRGERRILVVLGVLLLGPLLLGGLVAAGALDRFSEGMADGNARARVDVYGVLSYLSWNELLLGGDIGAVRKLAWEKFKLPYIESSVVVLVVQFGLIGAAVFALMLGRLVMTILRGGGLGGVVLGTVIFFAAALSNNGLSSKTASVFLLLSLAIAFHSGPEPGPVRRTARSRP
ncbi:VpsF family polysaccharide biosynthesis protein [Methylobacterium durans]|uniref:VpsF family polysaccharide biosynthesis protein n=1 Tax=Methylobacterium durans TaxID=2202825 RepID=UPI0013A5B6C9|nr:VpsF family polysaccharide biosynthesis protein [Methylobacterium durans]